MYKKKFYWERCGGFLKKVYSIVLVVVLLLLIGWLGYRNVAGSSDTAIGAINKNYGPVSYVVKELPMNGGDLVFYIRNLNKGISFDLRFVKKTFGRWKVTPYGGGMGGSSIAYQPSEQDIQAMPIDAMFLSSRTGANLEPLMVGIVSDPNISRLVVKDPNGLERQATIIKINDTFKIFYQFVSGKEQPSYELIAYDSKGTVIKKMNVDTTHKSSSSSGHPQKVGG